MLIFTFFLNTVDPWTKQVWTMWVHLYEIFFLFSINYFRTTPSALGWIHRCRTGDEEKPCIWCVHVLSRSVGYQGFPSGANDKESICQCRRHKKHEFNPWVRKILWRKKWQPTPVFLLGKIPRTEEPGRLQAMGSQKSRTQLCYWTPTRHKGGVICISEVIDISPGNLVSSLCFFQSSISHNVLCI